MILGAIVIVVVGTLVVNYFRGQEGETLPGETIEQEGPTVVRNGQTFHIVQEGDNLWKIAERYYESGYNWVDIAEENNLTNPNLIETDQELTIPNVEPRQPTVAQAVLADETEDQDGISESSYTVERGDDLWNIAVRAYGDGYRWVEIARENNLANPNLIHAGNILVLPR